MTALYVAGGAYNKPQGNLRGKQTVSKALYRKYRSKSLDEIVGQSHVTDILSSAIKQGRISHAYLLTGPRGVGKTSIARILAHEINSLPYDEENTHLDIIEIDAASNNGVEDVRDLREKVQIAPVSAGKKIYIIDEVHMLSKAAFNALLKTIEEPPEHVVFILATTDVDKVPATIISRTQRFSFRSISVKDAVNHLKHIAESEKIKVSDEALELIAERGDGSFRDSISLLDQLASLADPKKGITTELIETSIGLAPRTIIDQLLESVESHDITGLVKLLDDAIEQGINGVVLSQQLTLRVRDLVTQKPQLLPLLDSLLDVAKSNQPNLKLLSVLGSAAAPKQTIKSVALATPVLEIVTSIAELEKQATRIKPSEDSVNQARVSKAAKQFTADSTAPTGTLDWDKLIEYVRQNYVAVYSVLSKCNYEIEDNILTLYAGNKFYKKKLDDTKYNTLLHESLREVGVYGLDIHIIPTAPPLKDSQAAAVAVIMGGGEEVSVETS
ncbi:DNA polymerase III subunit gamma/tau [Candidatus Saccharibacteria bacterium]|nr:DNA polymerase III subunit gamma/tau [Candidatus Saccharibacteria bacterium]